MNSSLEVTVRRAGGRTLVGWDAWTAARPSDGRTAASRGL